MRVIVYSDPTVPVVISEVDSVTVTNDEPCAKRLGKPVARIVLSAYDNAEMFLGTDLAADMVTGLLDFLIENADDVPTREARSISYLAGLLADARVFEEVKS